MSTAGRGAIVLLLLGACGGEISDEGTPAGRPRGSSVISSLLEGTKGGGRGLLRRPPSGENVMVNGPSPAPARNEPSVAWLPIRAGRLVVSANDYRSPGPLRSAAGYYASPDGGRSFTVDGLLPGLTQGTGGSYEGAGNTAIDCSWNGDGVCYVVSLVYDRTAPRSGIAVSRSPDGGRSFALPLLVASDNDAHVLHDKGWIAVDKSFGARHGAVYVTWTRFEFDDALGYVASPIYLSRSTDRGRTFSAPQKVSQAPFDTSQGSRPVVDRHGRLHVVYQHYPDMGPTQHMIQSSDDGGQTFSAPLRVSQAHEVPMPIPPGRYRTNSFPALAADPVTGALHVAWDDYRSGVADILLSSSLDGGRRWGQPVRVNDTPQGARIQHVFPAVACGPLGLCGVSFYSTRGDPANALLLDTYYASIDLRGGPGRARVVTGRNIRVSDRATDPNVQFGGQYIGDYTGLAIGWSTAHPVWTDTRVQLIDDMGAATQVQSVFTSRLDLLINSRR